MSDLPYLPAVREQYNAYPYPPRDPADERIRLRHAISGDLLIINHHCFGGAKDFRKGFRALVAGGGTGDTAIFLAEQLRNCDSTVVYLDMSTTTRQVAEARAEVRGLTNITWITASIMELPTLGVGKFDYIECCGVLHHLESPEAGLEALKSVLKDDGAIFLMLYGKYGRQAVYDMQALRGTYLPAEMDMAEKVRTTRKLLASLPKTNNFIRDLAGWQSEIGTDGLGDAGLYDLLLHSQDRCFDVPGLYTLAKSARLNLLSFVFEAHAYDPLNHISDPSLREYLVTLDLPQRQALAEQFVGTMRRHDFFLTRQPSRGATLRDDTLALRSYGTLFANAPKLAADMVPGRVIYYPHGPVKLQIIATPITKEIYAHMDGKTPLRVLKQRIRRAVPDATPAAINEEIARVYEQLHPRGLLYLVRAGDYGAKVPDVSRLL